MGKKHPINSDGGPFFIKNIWKCMIHNRVIPALYRTMAVHVVMFTFIFDFLCVCVYPFFFFYLIDKCKLQIVFIQILVFVCSEETPLYTKVLNNRVVHDGDISICAVKEGVYYSSSENRKLETMGYGKHCKSS